MAWDADALHEQIDAGFLLPTEWYADAGLFQAELSAIHRKAWHFATHIGDLAEPGDTYVRNIAGVPVVLTRAADGQVRGFINICRHRGHPVVLESGNRPKLFCMFHGWTYGLDGTLLRAPRGEGDPTFDLAEFGLVPIQVHVWGPMVWANLDLEAPPFTAWIAGLPEWLADKGLDVAEHAYGFDATWEIRCNWKVFQDNTIECYHCPTTHPEFATVVEMRPELQKFGVGGRWWIHHTIPFKSHFHGSLTTRETPGRPFNYHYTWVFPTTYLQYSGLGFDIGALDILAVDRIAFRHIGFMPIGTPQAKLDEGQRQLAADATIRQDVELCTRVQAGHASGMAPTNRVFPEPEFLLSHFQHVIVDMVLGERRKAAAE
jgi:phenylpropionate dioxygenase-like ring-hydroxylating dioxygenase large terminal subunit